MRTGSPICDNDTQHCREEPLSNSSFVQHARDSIVDTFVTQPVLFLFLLLFLFRPAATNNITGKLIGYPRGPERPGQAMTRRVRSFGSDGK